MRIIVLGAGAIGSLYGAKLAATHEVTLVARPAHAAAIARDGLRVRGVETMTVRVPAVTEIDRLDPDTLILLTTKVSATQAALSPIAGLIRPDTTILCLQNGLASEDIARAAVGGRGVVLRGITQFGAIFREPGFVEYMVRGFTLVEPHGRSGPIAEALTAGGLDARISTDIRREVWRKLIFNCVINPITSITGTEVGGIADPGIDALKQLVVGECLAVAAAAEGVAFDFDFVRKIDAIFASSRNIASMRQDLLNGRSTEIDHMNGAVVDLGARIGLACPVNAALVQIIKAMEVQFRHTPVSETSSKVP